MAPRFLVPWKRALEVHASCGAHASGLGAESMGTANTRREKSLLMNRMTYAREKYLEMEKETLKFSLEIYSNKTWEVGEWGSFLDFNIKVYIHYSTAQTRARGKWESREVP